MNSFNADFQITEENNCSLYQTGDRFRLTERAFSPPARKQACLILVREMTELLFSLLTEAETGGGEKGETIYSCSGCHGLIKFKATSVSDSNAVQSKQDRLDPEKQALFDKIIDCPVFRMISADHLKAMINFFREKNIAPGQTLIRKGDLNMDLFLVLSGELSVDDGPVHITNLGPGELCGEMSFFTQNIAGATVTSLSETAVIAVSGEFFGQIVEESPSVQLFLSQLLAKRLVQANKARLHDFDSSMQGGLKDMAPAELFQILNMHQKTGVLSFSFAGKDARVLFREGGIIKARYNGLENQAALYAVLAETEGSYTFRSGLAPYQMSTMELGDFTALLMEGIQRIDEGRTPS